MRGYVAVKVVRNVQKYRDAAMIELAVLATLAANDARARFHCVHLRDWFDYRGHVCMVFERLGPSLYDFLRKNHYRPFPARLVRAFGRQLLEATAYLHSLRLVHTDLKPENVLLVAGDYDRVEAGGGGAGGGGGPDAPPAPPPPPTTATAAAVAAAAARGGGTAARVPRSSAVRVIDFGSATFEDAHHSAVVSTRHYRAPEVILGLGWSYPADLWSLGCILLELATGDALFQTHENLEHLAMMEAALGRALPSGLASRASPAAARLFRDGPPAGGGGGGGGAAAAPPPGCWTGRRRPPPGARCGQCRRWSRSGPSWRRGRTRPCGRAAARTRWPTWWPACCSTSRPPACPRATRWRTPFSRVARRRAGLAAGAWPGPCRARRVAAGPPPCRRRLVLAAASPGARPARRPRWPAWAAAVVVVTPRPPPRPRLVVVVVAPAAAVAAAAAAAAARAGPVRKAGPTADQPPPPAEQFSLRVT